MKTARETIERLLQAGRDMDTDAFIELMAPGGYLEWPYRPPGVPARLQGHAEIRRHLTAAVNFVRFDEYRDVVVHETTDPEVIIVEYEAYGRIVPTGAAFEQTVIAVFRVQEGLVVSYRDYINPLPLMEARASL